MKRIFISYNPVEQAEQSLAIRLQTLGSLYGLHVSLPDRVGTKALKITTKERIQSAGLFIVFSTRSLTKQVKDEIDYALTLKKQIVVVYDKDVRTNINLSGVTEIEYDKRNDSPEKVLGEVLKVVNTKKDDSFSGFILVGLGLLLLAAIMSDSKK